MQVLMTSPRFRVKSIKRKTSNEVLTNTKVGDLICFECPVKRAGISRGRTYATYITVRNLTQNTETLESFNTVERVFDILELDDSTLKYHAGSLCGEELYLYPYDSKDGTLVVSIQDRNLKWDIYCNDVLIEYCSHNTVNLQFKNNTFNFRYRKL